MEHDFIVEFTLFTPKGFKTMYRHFDKLETAKLFASNKNIKNNCKIYVDLEFHKDEMKNLINENNDLHKEINRRIKLKIENEKIVDNERNLWFTFNFNEIIYYTIEKVGEENV